MDREENSDPIPPSSPVDSEDRFGRVLDLAIRLLREIPPGLPNDISDPAWTKAFDGAVKRAEFLLRRKEHGGYDIHAYELFKEGDLLSAQRIAVRFKDAGWKPGLTSKNSISVFLDQKLKPLIRDFPGNLPKIVVEGAKKRLEAVVTESDPILGKRIVTHLWSDDPKAPDPMIKALESKVRGTTEAQEEKRQAYQTFFNWCFVVDDKGAKYRANEIFRFAATQSWFEEELRMKLCDLRPDFHTDFTEPGNHFRLFREKNPSLNLESQG